MLVERWHEWIMMVSFFFASFNIFGQRTLVIFSNTRWGVFYKLTGMVFSVCLRNDFWKFTRLVTIEGRKNGSNLLSVMVIDLSSTYIKSIV